MIKTAIFIDGAYFLKRFRSIYSRKNPSFDLADPEKVVKELYTIALRHLNANDKEPEEMLYRIFYYDCPPMDKKVHNPISNKCIDYSKTFEYEFKTKFLKLIVNKRKMCLRLGKLAMHNEWVIDSKHTKELVSGRIVISSLKENDINLNIKQKGVDMKLGIDIVTLAYKKLVDKIVLFAGDSDFVPAAKIARIEGIDFVLDPMWNHIDPSLNEHIDGLKSTIMKPD